MQIGAGDPDILSEMIKGQFLIQTDQSNPWTTILFEFPTGTDEHFDDDDEIDEDVVKRTPVEVLRVNPDTDVVEIFPLKKYPEKKFPTRRYRHIEKLSLEGFGFDCPEDTESVVVLLSNLPSGFIKNPDFGLGLRKEYRFIVETIETIGDIKHIQISRGQTTAVSGDTYILNFRRFEAIRKAINNTHTQALSNARADKSILAYNSLLHELDSTAYPERRRPYTNDTIFKAVEGRVVPKLSEKDQLAAVTLVEKNKNSLAKSHPEKLIQLQREIELVTLKQLIETMNSLLDKRILEEKWQKFFVDYPFVLSLAFALPIVVIQDQVSVGGRNFSGKEEKIADFLAKNGLTDNLALIEIKTPQTGLLGRQYRGGVYSASADLVGCVTQILDQRHKIQAELNTRKINSRQFDIEAYAIRCLIIIGMTPDTLDRKKSLELFRNNLHDVTVVTFDELLEKLRHIHKFLSTEPVSEPKSATPTS